MFFVLACCVKPVGGVWSICINSQSKKHCIRGLSEFGSPYIVKKSCFFSSKRFTQRVYFDSFSKSFSLYGECPRGCNSRVILTP